MKQNNQTIKDKKTQYFYKNELKSLFFDKIRQSRSSFKGKNTTVKKINTSLYNQQILSFIASAINHVPIRQKILEDLQATDLLNNAHRNLIRDIKSDDNLDLQTDKLLNKLKKTDHKDKPDGYDPILLAEKEEKIVIRGNKRKYARLARPLRFYGGTISATEVGCNLGCKFCFSDKPVRRPHSTGRFYTPQQVFNALKKKADQYRYKLISASYCLSGEIT